MNTREITKKFEENHISVSRTKEKTLAGTTKRTHHEPADEVIQAHAPMKRLKKGGLEPSLPDAYMRGIVRKLASVEFGEILESKPSKVRVTFNFSDDVDDFTVDKRLFEKIKNKYLAHVKVIDRGYQEDDIEESNDTALESNQEYDENFEINEELLVLSPKWKGFR